MVAAAREAGLRVGFEVGVVDGVGGGEVHRGAVVEVKRWYREVAKVRG